MHVSNLLFMLKNFDEIFAEWLPEKVVEKQDMLRDIEELPEEGNIDIGILCDNSEVYDEKMELRMYEDGEELVSEDG